MTSKASRTKDARETTDSSIPPPIIGMTNTPFFVDRDQEVAMPEPQEDQGLGSVENHTTIIMHLIKQLGEGKDLTKVPLPTFILEPRSLLEMFADYVAHPQLLIDVTNGTTPHERMKNFVKWFLTAFHSGKRDKVAKKPFNPIIGEVFQCSWRLSTPSTKTTAESENPKDSGGKETEAEPIMLTYYGEQVSHRPPVSAFQINCPKRRFQMGGAVHTASRFRGFSIYVEFVGKVVLGLEEHNEDYVFSLPTAYGRSILTVPWFEFGDKITVKCPQTGYTATIIFYTKDDSSGCLHRISAEIFSPETAEIPKKVVVSVKGHWDSILQFVDHVSGTTETIDTTKMKAEPKWIRPISLQKPEESQKLWFNVAAALKQGDIDLATEEKTKLEDIQRVSEEARKNKNLPHTPKFFKATPDGYIFIDYLKSKGENPQ